MDLYTLIAPRSLGKHGMARKVVTRPDASSGEKMSARAEDMASAWVSQKELKRVDEILVQQHVIRRFRLHHGTDFEKLIELRCELDRLLCDAGLKTAPRLFEGSRVAALACCMNFVGDRANLARISDGEREWIARNLQNELDKQLDGLTSGSPLTDEEVAAIAEVLISFAPAVADLDQRLNYLHYYSLFGITNYVPGKKLYSHYVRAMSGDDKIGRTPDIFSRRPKQAWWLYTVPSAEDEQLAAIATTSGHQPLHASSNVRIFGGHQHEVAVNGVPLKDRLILSVPTTEAPDKIDEALRQFRDALLQEFIDNTGAYCNVSDDSFDRSAFMTTFVRETCLVDKWDQIKKWIVGLWAWDLRNLKGRTVDKMCEDLAEGQNTFTSTPLPEKELYVWETIKDCYEDVADLIGPVPTEKRPQRARRIDPFITRSDALLGRINDTRD